MTATTSLGPAGKPAATGGRGHYAAGPGFVLGLIRSRPVWTRAQLVAETGLARSTVSERVDELAAARLVLLGTEALSTGGRPAESIRFNSSGGYLLVADIGGSHSRVGLADLGGNLLATADRDVDVSVGPVEILGATVAQFLTLLEGANASPEQVRGIGVGVPGPVDVATSRIVRPRTMPGWDTSNIPDHFVTAFPGVPVVVDKDANIMALGEYHSAWSEQHSTVITVKVGMGLGCGLITGGQIIHGAQGAAGDIAHLSGWGDVECLCGQTGCLEAVAGGRAIAAKLNAAGRSVTTSRGIVELLRGGDAMAIRLVRRAGGDIGQALIPAIALLNPSLVVVGGNLADSPEPLLAGIREVVYAKAHPLTTESLQIVPSKTGAQAGLTGAARLALNAIFADSVIDAQLASART